jgi:hypothetical protein
MTAFVIFINRQKVMVLKRQLFEEVLPKWQTTYINGYIELSPFEPMADGVLTSSLAKRWSKLFSDTQALPENRGACVDTRFGPIPNQGQNPSVTGENG